MFKITLRNVALLVASIAFSACDRHPPTPTLSENPSPSPQTATALPVSQPEPINSGPAPASNRAVEAPVRQTQPAQVALPWTPNPAPESFNDRAYPALRDWTSSSGTFHTAAKFSGMVEEQAQLHKGAGGDVLVPLDKLSEKDRVYIKELIRVDPTASVVLGKVIRVFDNQSISVTDDTGHSYPVHLEGVELLGTEELPGSRAKEALTGKILDKHVWIEWHENDMYSLKLGQVYFEGRNINLEMVAEGYVRHNRLPRTNPRFANAELIAQRKRLGLWGDSFAESPLDARGTR